MRRCFTPIRFYIVFARWSITHAKKMAFHSHETVRFLWELTSMWYRFTHAWWTFPELLVLVICLNLYNCVFIYCISLFWFYVNCHPIVFILFFQIFLPYRNYPFVYQNDWSLFHSIGLMNVICLFVLLVCCLLLNYSISL